MQSAGIEGLREKPLFEMLLKGKRGRTKMESAAERLLPRFGAGNR